MVGDYLGQEVVDVASTPYAKYTTSDWVMYFISYYGQIDGGHHKQWVLDQIARVIKGTPVIIELAKWEGGPQEYRVNLGEPSDAYKQWVAKYEERDENGDAMYTYDVGCAP